MADNIAFGISVEVQSKNLDKLIKDIAEGQKGFEDFVKAIVEGSVNSETALSDLQKAAEKAHESVWQTGDMSSWQNLNNVLEEAISEAGNLTIQKGFEAKAHEEVKAKVAQEKEEQKKLTQQQKELEASTKQLAKEQKAASEEFEKYAKKAASLLGQYFAIKKTFSAIMGFAKEGEELSRMAKLSGTSAESIQKLGIALKNYGGSASSASSTLGKLNRQMEDLKFGKKNNLYQVAVQYGLNINAKTPEEMLRNIAKRMEGMGALQQVNLGRKLGLDNATIMLLQQGLEGVNKELEKAGKQTIFTDKDIENSEKMNRAYREFQDKLEQLKATLIRGLLPVFEILLKKLSNFADYLKEHPKILKTVAAAVMVLAAAFSTLTAIKFTGFILGMGQLTGAFALQTAKLLPYLRILMALIAAYKGAEMVVEGLTSYFMDKSDEDNRAKNKERTKAIESLTPEEKADLTSGKITFNELMEQKKSGLKTVEDNFTYSGRKIKQSATEIGQAYVQQADNFPLNSSSASAASILNNNSKSQDKIYNFNFGGVTIEADNPKEFMEKFGNQYGLQFANGFE